MNINPYLPSPSPATERRQASIAPVQPTSAPRDPVREQREAAQRLAVPQAVRRQAEQALEARGGLLPAAEDPQARRALHAYQAVARQDEHEYVTNILGIDEFA